MFEINEINDNNEVSDENNIFKIFHDDVYEKKLPTHKAIMSKTSLLPNKKELKKLNGSVKTMTNIYESIMDYQAFKKMNSGDKKNAINNYFQRFKVKEIADAWGLNKQYIYDIKSKCNKTNEDLQNMKLLKASRSKAIDAVVKKQPSVKKQDYIVEMTVNKELQGEKIHDFILKFAEIFSQENNIDIKMTIENISKTGKIDFKIQVEDTFVVKEFCDEIIQVIFSLPKAEMFKFMIVAKEYIK